MCRRFHTSLILALILVIGLLLAFSSPSKACGGYFPNGFLLSWDRPEEDVMRAPDTTFALEFERLIPQPETPKYPYIPTCQTAQADVEDLREALQAQGIAGDQLESVLARYSDLRLGLAQYSTAMVNQKLREDTSKDFLTAWEEWVGGLRARGWKQPDSYHQVPDHYMPLDNLSIAEVVPPEFACYLRGAIYYYQGDWEHARESWVDVLSLPCDQCHYRSTWAAYMMGKTLLDKKPAQAIEWFHMVRDMADQGYADNLGLASSSFLWEAKADIKLGRYIEAIERYLDLYNSGDGFVPEVLPPVIKYVFDAGPSTLQEAAGNPIVRRVISIYVSSHGGYTDDTCIPNEQVVAWLEAVEAIDAGDIETADLLAWAAYRSGRMDLARRWLDRSPETGLALWLQAKLSMRGGRLQEAAAFLETASEKLSSDVILGGYLYYSGETYYESFPHNTVLTGWFTFPSRRALAELGVLQLAIGNYVKALDSSFKAGYWLDAAYIAERVLTPDELKAYVDENWPDPGPGFAPSESRYYEDTDHFMARGPKQQAYVIRYLLARRLTRIGRCQEARDYYPEKWRPVLDAYVLWIRRGNDTSLGDQDRAEALWQAARIARYQGIDLMGTELEPDWAVAWGSWGGDGTSSCRADRHFMGPFHSSPSERERIRRSELETQPQKRFHYRYIALDLAWAAVELMPDESDETARRLCEAGGWLKNRDPEAADPFYKAMVIRCGTTVLGQEADQRHWFPDCEQ